MNKKCTHEKIEFLGEEKGEIGVNRYYKCLKCGNVLVLSEEGVLYEIPRTNSEKTRQKP